jgi:hypothetical protein
MKMRQRTTTHGLLRQEVTLHWKGPEKGPACCLRPIGRSALVDQGSASRSASGYTTQDGRAAHKRRLHAGGVRGGAVGFWDGVIHVASVEKRRRCFEPF